MNTKQNKTTFLYSTRIQSQDNSNKKLELKWTNECSDQNIVCDSVCLIAFRCTNYVKLRNFQYDFLMRIVPNNRYLFKCKRTPTSLCDFCTMQEENNAHLFWGRMYTQEFWSHLRNFLNDHFMQVDIFVSEYKFCNNMKNEMIKDICY